MSFSIPGALAHSEEGPTILQTTLRSGDRGDLHFNRAAEEVGIWIRAAVEHGEVVPRVYARGKGGGDSPRSSLDKSLPGDLITEFPCNG